MEVPIITGCDSGMGYEMVKTFLKNNKTVIFTYLLDNPFPKEENAYGFKLDLEDKNSIVQFTDEVIKLLDTKKLKLNCLFNNAGIAIGGPIENTPMEIYRKVMEVNFFGLLNLTKLLMPELIKNSGKIIIHGSMAGRISMPFLSPYAASKYALEALADGLRRELHPYNVQISLFETGGIATPIWSKAEKQDISFIDTKYSNSVEAFYKNFVGGAKKGVPVNIAVNKMYKVINRKKLPIRYRVSKNPLINFLPILIPDFILDKILRKLTNIK